MGWPFPLALALAARAVGRGRRVVGLPALRVKGIYLGIATLAFGFIVEEVFARWESVTGGNAGMHVQGARAVRLRASTRPWASTSCAWCIARAWPRSAS